MAWTIERVTSTERLQEALSYADRMLKGSGRTCQLTLPVFEKHCTGIRKVYHLQNKQNKVWLAIESEFLIDVGGNCPVDDMEDAVRSFFTEYGNFAVRPELSIQNCLRAKLWRRLNGTS